MYEMDKDDFIFEVKEELSCFEDMGKDGAEKWAEGFKKWLKEHPGTKIDLDDESVIFEIADEYIEAVENGSVDSYWKSFRI